VKQQTNNVVTLLPVPPLVLELSSERFVDAVVALKQAGFVLENVQGTRNRFKVRDTKETKK
jgi:hypothetical protein